MMDGTETPFLPKGGCARVIVGTLALPAFLIFLLFLIVIPTVYIPWPPQGINAAMALFAMCQLLGAGVLFTLLALIWAIAAPQWVASLLEIRARRLTATCGYFMLINGAGFIGLAISGHPTATLVLGTGSVGVGMYLLVALRSRRNQPTAGRSDHQPPKV